MLNLFEIPASDQSQVFLGQIFGNVGIALAGTGPMLLSHMFKIFNSSLLVLGTFLVAYVTIAGVLRTAQEGEFMGKQWNSLWMPLRMLMGIAGLVPTSSGYCAIQIIMMWIILQGVGAADSVWTGAVNYFKAGGALFPSTPTAASYSDAAGTLPPKLAALFQNIVCQAAVTKMGANNPNAIAVTQAPIVTSSQITYNFGRVDPSDSAAASECGTIVLNGSKDANGVVDVTALAAQQQATQAIIQIMETLANYYANQVVNPNSSCWKQCDITKPETCIYFGKYSDFMENCSLVKSDKAPAVSADILSRAGSNFIADAVSLFYGYATNYTTQYNLAHNQTSAQVTQEPYDRAIANGWIFAGAYYYYIASSTNRMSDVYNSFINGVTVENPKFPIAFGPNSPTPNPPDFSSKGATAFPLGVATMASSVSSSLAKAAAATVGNSNVVIGSGDSAGIPSQGAPLLSVITNACVSVTNHFIKVLSGNGGDPLVAIHGFGHDLLTTADYLFLAAFGVALIFGISSTVFVVFGSTVNPLEGVSKAILSYLLPLLFFVITYLIIIGGLLGIYLPLLPFMIFTFGAVGWFLGVLEAMTAAPVIAIGILMPGGQHEIMGRAEQSIMMTVNIFLRPMLMIFGLMAALLLGFVLVQFINGGFSLVLAKLATQVGVVEALLYLMAYAFVLITVLNKCYSLIHYLADRVITWVGGHAAGFGEEQMAGEVKGGISAGGSAVGKAGAGFASGAAQAGADLRKHNQKKAAAPGVVNNPPKGGANPES